MPQKSTLNVIKILFVPVSAAKGSGEYQRCLLIANELKLILEDKIDIRFVISCDATYADSVPFMTYKLAASATKMPRELHAIIAELSPNMTVFDCSGRVKSYRFAKKNSSKVALIVSRPKKRKRAFSWRVAPFIDLIVSASHLPKLCELSLSEKITMYMLRSLHVELVNALFQAPRKLASNVTNILPKKYCFLFLTGGQYIFDNVNVPKLTSEIAHTIANKCEMPCVIINSNIKEPHTSNNIISLPPQSNADFISLLSSAEICVVGTGDVAAQALALNKPSIMVATSKTGRQYLADYIELNVTLGATLSPEDIANNVIELNSSKAKESQKENQNKYGFSNGTKQTVDAILNLVNDQKL